jgi:anti-sigma regulatory factor (Ser/Thr protein kinase)
MTLELQATPENVMRAVEALQEFARARHIPEATIFGLALALEECGSNIVNHALQRDPRQKFHVFIRCTSAEFVLELRDRGSEFDPNAMPGRRPKAEHNDEPGGWGIQLVRRFIDDIRYRREGGENVLRLVKRLGSKTGR